MNSQNELATLNQLVNLVERLTKNRLDTHDARLDRYGEDGKYLEAITAANQKIIAILNEGDSE